MLSNVVQCWQCWQCWSMLCNAGNAGNVGNVGNVDQCWATLCNVGNVEPGEGRHWEGGGNKLSDKIHWNLSRWESEHILQFWTFYHSTVGMNVTQIFVLRDKSQCGRAAGRSGDSDPLEKGGSRLKNSLQGSLPPFSNFFSLWLFKWSSLQNISVTRYCHPCPGQCLAWSVKL